MDEPTATGDRTRTRETQMAMVARFVAVVIGAQGGNYGGPGGSGEAVPVCLRVFVPPPKPRLVKRNLEMTILTVVSLCRVPQLWKMQ